MNRWKIAVMNDYCEYTDYPMWAKGDSKTYCRLTEDDDADGITEKECCYENCPIKVENERRNNK